MSGDERLVEALELAHDALGEAWGGKVDMDDWRRRWADVPGLIDAALGHDCGERDDLPAPPAPGVPA